MSLPLMACYYLYIGGLPVGGSIQFDLSYATIKIFVGDTRHLYREPKMTYTLYDPRNPSNILVFNRGYLPTRPSWPSFHLLLLLSVCRY